jgi:hypothetical protein
MPPILRITDLFESNPTGAISADDVGNIAREKGTVFYGVAGASLAISDGFPPDVVLVSRRWRARCELQIARHGVTADVQALVLFPDCRDITLPDEERCGNGCRAEDQGEESLAGLSDASSHFRTDGTALTGGNRCS